MPELDFGMGAIIFGIGGRGNQRFFERCDPRGENHSSGRAKGFTFDGTTDASERFLFRSVQPGSYKLQVDLDSKWPRYALPAS